MTSVANLDAVDLRMGGNWTPLQRTKNALIRSGIRNALFVADRLPERHLRRLGRVVGALAYVAFRRARGTTLENLTRALPERDHRIIARRVFVNAGENLARCLLLRRPAFRALDTLTIPEQSWAIFREALNEGRGLVFVSAHLGPFELLPAAIAELGVRPSVVVRESYDPELDGIVDAHRHARQFDVIHRGRAGAAARIVRALRAGRPVGFLPDVGGRVPCRSADFLGQRVAFPVGPQRIARRIGCPLLIGTFCPPQTSEEGRFSLAIERIDTQGDEELMTHRVANSLSRSIAQLAEHWLWMAPLRSLRTQDE